LDGFWKIGLGCAQTATEVFQRFPDCFTFDLRLGDTLNKNQVWDVSDLKVVHGRSPSFFRLQKIMMDYYF